MSTLSQASVAALALAAALAAPVAQAQEKMTVTRDAETGELRAPTAAEIDALKKLEAKQRASSRAPARAVGGVETRYADGTVGLTLGEEDMMQMVAVRGADGKVRMECLPADQAQKIVRNPKAASSKAVQAQPVQAQKDEAGRDLY